MRASEQDLNRELRDLRAGRPEAVFHLGLTGARLAHVDGGALLAADFTFQQVTRDRQPTLATALPAQAEQAPDRILRAGVRGALRGGTGAALSGDLRSQALDLVPATLHTIHLGLQPAGPATAQKS